MNCTEFEEHVGRGTLEDLSGSVLDAALAHAESCDRCSRLFAVSQGLPSALRRLAESVPQQAPPRVEQTCLAAFRRRAEAARARRRWMWAGMAAAAALVLAVTGRDLRHKTRLPARQGAAVMEVRAAGPAESAKAPASGARSSSERRPRRPGPEGKTGKALKNAPVPTRPKPRVRRPSRAEVEWATDFLPLPYGSGTTADGGELVTIEVPRSSLAAWGLAAAGSPDGAVAAQVFIGEDGLARAIRFAR